MGIEGAVERRRSKPAGGLRLLIGSGDRIVLFTLPFLIAGILGNVLFPAVFQVGGPPAWLFALAIAMLVPGLATWAWSAGLILSKVPHGELITGGPYAVVKHPLYTAVALLVFPSVAFLCNSWLGLAIGVVMYIAIRMYAPAEERELARTFGARWDAYCRKVLLPYL